MSEIDDYLSALDEPERSTLRELREAIREVIPEAEECISYGMPAFRIDGKVVAGFAAFKSHLSYFPHSGSVIPELGDLVSSWATSPGTLRFTVDRPLPKDVIAQLLAVRIRQALPGR